MNMKKNQSFEGAIGRLETISEKLENQETPLEESLKLFEEATALVRFCDSVLSEAQLKVLEITKTGEEYQEETFEGSADVGNVLE